MNIICHHCKKTAIGLYKNVKTLQELSLCGDHQPEWGHGGSVLEWKTLYMYSNTDAPRKQTDKIMKYKAGDKVRIKDQKWYDENKDIYGNVYCSPYNLVKGMDSLLGEVLTVELVFNDYYEMGGIEYIWTDEMIEGLVSEEKLNTGEWRGLYENNTICGLPFEEYLKIMEEAAIKYGTKNQPDPESNLNPVNPDHYKGGTKEVYEMMIDIWGKDSFKMFCEMNEFKYRMRAGLKGNPTVDIEKAMWYKNKRSEV